MFTRFDPPGVGRFDPPEGDEVSSVPYPPRIIGDAEERYGAKTHE
jgi:hypothetical protein